MPRPLAALLTALAALAPVPAPAAIDTHRVATAHYGNDAPWYEARIPFFESADPAIDRVYYYRWMIVRAHQRDLGERGFITTEFLDDVGWQLEPWASLNDATGFHLGEARWMHDRRPADDYIAFMYTGGNDRHFTDYLAASVYDRYLVDGDRAAAIRHLPAMRTLYTQWDDHFDAARGLYWVEPLLDATEYTISSIDASGGLDGFTGGDAFRPSINAYMVANARAIARLSRLAGEEPAIAADYDRRAATLAGRMEEALFIPALGHFADRHRSTNAHVRAFAPIRGRELVGYLPWTFDVARDDPQLAAAWRHLLSAEELGGRFGMRTVEPSYEHYMRQYRYDGGGHDGGRRECQWNGPVWPYQTTQVLTGMANLLDHYRHSPVTRGDYLRLLRQYTALHQQGGRLDLEENYEPDTGLPIVGLARSHHYFHSGYVDLILTGLVGIRPRADDVLEVNPLLPAAGEPQALAWFRVQDVPYHGHRVAVTWDADGSHYGRRGLAIEVDGREVARRPGLERIVLPLRRAALPAIERPVDRAVQLVRGAFPKGSASTGTDAEKVHDAIDGRVWFMPELGNGWSSAPAPAAQWYAVDFGKPVSLSRAELAFFADGGRYAVPRGYRVQAWVDGTWQDLRARADAPLANGITHARWPATTTSRVRVTFDLAPNRAMRLVELKLF
ncbi:MGH1-like glycoside hydrolase domain-containing protein [Sphingomonas corticis]|jgi:hypothetical protein|uniref:Discoidin domain-containing protein n=1 Tax=Sphingomonas corticis TaxID=2722791 RepID=A0ABX1CU40_9SPHN|nr:discoidin domain-containing protein [Sphingomonas corticis]NJR79505.1 discoidin domain-containing protein [Sphingomonas corticis]